MALAKQVIPINFNGGLDTKTDAKTVLPGKLLLLENGYWKKANQISKRFGYDVLNSEVENIDGASVDSGQALGVFNNELNLYTGDKLYTYADSTDTWVYKGDVTSSIAESTSIITNSHQQSHPSVNYNSGLSAYAWEDSRGGIRYSVFDQLTGSVILSDAILSADGIRPRVLSFGDRFVLIYAVNSNTSLRYKTIQSRSPAELSTESTLTTDVAGTPNYDAVVVGDRLFFVYADDTATTSVRYLTSTYTISGATVVGENSVFGLGAFSDKSQNIWVATYDGTSIKYFILSYSLTQVLAPTTIENISVTVCGIVGVVNGERAAIFYECSAVQTYNHRVRAAAVDIGGAVLSAGNYKLSVGLAGKPFILRDKGVAFVPLVHQSSLQSTYFIQSSSSANLISAKISPQTAGNLITNSTLSEVPEIGDSRFLFVGGQKTRLVSDTGNLYSVVGVKSTVVSYTSENRFQNSQMGELYIVGGILQSYDGVSVVEDNFHLFPENISSSTNSAGGFMEPGAYSYQVTYEWTDNLGQIHRSAPSVAVQQVIPSGTSTNIITLTIPTLRLTAKQCQIVVYRTESNGTIYYRVSSVSSPIQNTTANNTVIFTDTTSDSSLISNEILYTTGDVLENSSAPACSLITTYRNRIVLAGLEDPLTYLYSKTRIPGTPVEFSDLFLGRIDPRGGKITALGAMDNYVIFFKKDSIFALTGNGPNASGALNDFGEPQLITTDVGCDNPNSVVITPRGLMFKSTKGIYLLDRALQSFYIGAPVEEFNNLLITSSQLLTDVNQVRFTTDNNICLVYDYFFDQWSTFTNHTAEDSALWNDRFVFLRSSGQVWVENQKKYADDSSPITLSAVTSWFSFAGIQGFQRIYRMIVLGEYRSPHRLEVNIGYDFNPNFSQSAFVDVNSIYDITSYGDDSPYGDEIEFGGEYPLYQFKTHMTKQKCQSARFKFSDNQNAIVGDYGEGFSITNIALEVGIKGTLRKFATKNSFSTAG